jgi:hypothetical protein
MGVLVMVESCILALTTGTALARGLAALPRPIGSTAISACPSHPGAQATGLIGEAVLDQGQPFVFTRVGLGPAVDMDSRRQHEEDQERRRKEQLRCQAPRNEEWRERYRNYGYAYPPFARAHPRLGPYYYDIYTGYYYNPDTGQYYRVNPGRGYSGDARPNRGPHRDYRPDRERREREGSTGKQQR